MTRRTVCDIREVSSVAALQSWAHAHGATVRYAGPDATGRPVYVAHVGVIERVARGVGRDPHRCPLVWRSPLERTT